jgi:hypothetical protein
MTYSPRIKADRAYLQALGQAFYNFTYLEWCVVWTIAKLSADGFASVPRGQTAQRIAQALTKAIDTTSPALPGGLRKQLVKLDERFRSAIKIRNKLLHAHPYTASDGAQQLRGGGHEWPISSVEEAAKFFEDAAIFGNAIFHGELAKVRS